MPRGRGAWSDESRAKFAATIAARRAAKAAGGETMLQITSNHRESADLIGIAGDGITAPIRVIAPEAPPKVATGIVSREMYLLARDAAAEVGVTPAVLAQMTKAVKAGQLRGSVRVYTVGDIGRLRQLKGFMDDLEVGAPMAAKIIRALEKRKQCVVKARTGIGCVAASTASWMPDANSPSPRTWP